MLKVNDIVLYGAAGACTVKEFCKKQIGGKEHDYAVLETETPPKTTIYLPLENETLMARIQPVPSPDEILSMIRAMPSEEEIWIEDEEQRKQRYREIIASCERTALSRLIKTLYSRQVEQRRIGKKLHSADERVFKEAQRLLHNEISFVLHIPSDDVPDFIAGELRGTPRPAQ